MRTVAIIAKPLKDELRGLLPELIGWLGQREFQVVLDEVAAQYANEGTGFSRAVLPSKHPELVVVLGGDGTLLSAARAFAYTDTPILSVNLGSLGFLTGVSLEELYPTLDAWLYGQSQLDERRMMHAELFRNGALLMQWEALNDVVLSKGAIARMGDYVIDVDGMRVARFRADGVILATPTGSTAYNLAANGPIVASSVAAMVITPICPHLLTLRPIVVPSTARIHLQVEGTGDQTYLTVDGQEAIETQRGDEVRCTESQYRVRLVHATTGGLFAVLRSKLKWGER